MKGIDQMSDSDGPVAKKLSERIAWGENTDELREAIAIMMGHRQLQGTWGRVAWFRQVRAMAVEWLMDCPDYLNDIRLTIAEIERLGLGYKFISDNEFKNMNHVIIDGHLFVGGTQMSLARNACNALVLALEHRQGKTKASD